MRFECAIIYASRGRDCVSGRRSSRPTRNIVSSTRYIRIERRRFEEIEISWSRGETNHLVRPTEENNKHARMLHLRLDENPIRLNHVQFVP